jgi:hypothetical protein
MSSTPLASRGREVKDRSPPPFFVQEYQRNKSEAKIYHIGASEVNLRAIFHAAVPEVFSNFETKFKVDDSVFNSRGAARWLFYYRATDIVTAISTIDLVKKYGSSEDVFGDAPGFETLWMAARLLLVENWVQVQIACAPGVAVWSPVVPSIQFLTPEQAKAHFSITDGIARLNAAKLVATLPTDAMRDVMDRLYGDVEFQSITAYKLREIATDEVVTHWSLAFFEDHEDPGASTSLTAVPWPVDAARDITQPQTDPELDVGFSRLVDERMLQRVIGGELHPSLENVEKAREVERQQADPFSRLMSFPYHV